METRSAARRRRLREEALAASDRLNNLPDDCLFHIFEFLTVEDLLQIPKVCKRWRDFGSDSWRYVRKLDLIELGRTETVHKKLIQLCGKHLRDLTILVKKDSSSMIQLVTLNCPQLVKFRLQFKYSQGDKQQHCQDLQQLFSNNKETLRTVVLDNIGESFGEYADCLLELPEALIELQLWGYLAHRKPERLILPFRPFIPAITRLVNLEILVLNGLKIKANDIKIIEKFENLRKLKIDRSFEGRSEEDWNINIQAISSRRKLEYISLSNDQTTSVNWFRDLLQNNPNLKHLNVPWPDDLPEDLNGLFEWSQLETLHFDDDGDEDRELPNISISGLKKFEGCCSSAIVIAVLDGAPELEFLKVSSMIDSSILTRAKEVMKNRNNDIPLHMIVDGFTSFLWKRGDDMPPLLRIETIANYERRTKNKYTGYDVQC